MNPLKGIPLPPAMPPLPPPDVGPSATTGGSRAARAAAEDEDDGEEDDLRGGNPNLSKEQKLTQRMQRKAESARIARLRKKEYVNGLEQEAAAPLRHSPSPAPLAAYLGLPSPAPPPPCSGPCPISARGLLAPPQPPRLHLRASSATPR